MADHPEPDTAADIVALKSGLEEMRGLFTELKEATSAKEEAGIRADIGDAEADLEALAKRTGISAKTLRESISAAKRAERKDEFRDIVRELLEEMIGDDEDDDEKPKLPADDDDDEAVAKVKVKPPKPADSGPIVTHWSDRPLAEILR